MPRKLPDLVPFNDPVTVCAVCLRASCAQGRMRCDAAKAGPVAQKTEALFMLRALAKENPSYWQTLLPGQDDDTPVDVADMEHLIRYMREQPRTERSMLAGYLEHEIGIDPEQVTAAMAKEWPQTES